MADTIRTQAELLEIFKDGQPSNSITEQDIRDLIVSQPSIDGSVWEFTLDGTYLDSGSALAAPAGIRTKLTIDGTAADQHSPNLPSGSNIWNVSTNKFEPLALDDFYMMRLALTGYSDAASTNKFEIELDVSESVPRVIGRETGVFSKGAMNAQSFNFSTGFFTGAQLFANGGEIYITADSDASFWEIAITLSRTYTTPV